jgi:hypothetical protein
MARLTVSDLLERVEALEAEVAALRESHMPSISYVREMRPQEPISDPIDFVAMQRAHSDLHSYYSEYGDVWGANQYL